jgi:hypothetical protein
VNLKPTSKLLVDIAGFRREPQEESMNLHFWDIYRDVRSVIQKPDEAVYVLYTSIGAITVRRFVYRAEAGYFLLQGIDENGRDRIVGFSEQQLSSFAFEIRMKPAEKNGQIRFNLESG